MHVCMTPIPLTDLIKISYTVRAYSIEREREICIRLVTLCIKQKNTGRVLMIDDDGS